MMLCIRGSEGVQGSGIAYKTGAPPMQGWCAGALILCTAMGAVRACSGVPHRPAVEAARACVGVPLRSAVEAVRACVGVPHRPAMRAVGACVGVPHRPAARAVGACIWGAAPRWCRASSAHNDGGLDIPLGRYCTTPISHHMGGWCPAAGELRWASRGPGAPNKVPPASPPAPPARPGAGQRGCAMQHAQEKVPRCIQTILVSSACQHTIEIPPHAHRKPASYLLAARQPPAAPARARPCSAATAPARLLLHPQATP